MNLIVDRINLQICIRISHHTSKHSPRMYTGTYSCIYLGMYVYDYVGQSNLDSRHGTRVDRNAAAPFAATPALSSYTTVQRPPLQSPGHYVPSVCQPNNRNNERFHAVATYRSFSALFVYKRNVVAIHFHAVHEKPRQQRHFCVFYCDINNGTSNPARYSLASFAVISDNCMVRRPGLSPKLRNREARRK